MVEVVARHGFDNGFDCHIAALGVVEHFGSLLGREGCNKRGVPGAHGGKDGERGLRIHRGVGGGPSVLVERLDDVIGLRESLSQAESKNHFTVGEVSKNVAGGPFPGCGIAGERAGESRGVGRQLRRGLPDDFPWIAIAEEFRVRIGHRPHCIVGHMDISKVSEHYGTAELLGRVTKALERFGMGEGMISWQALEPLDQFHVRALPAIRELAAALSLDPTDHVLDVGSGLGGPARCVAAEHACRVTGVDLNERYVEVARMLTERTGLSDRVHFEQADALQLPFKDQTFDHAMTIHVAMNIRDRAGLYGSIHRVLKGGGRLAIYDVVTGNGEALTFPLPWAREAEASFLTTSEVMRETLEAAGFADVKLTDRTVAGLGALAAQQAAMQSDPETPRLGLPLIMGAGFMGMVGNLGRDLQTGKVRLVEAVARKV
jgi:SAM-dependent methyltransferase